MILTTFSVTILKINIITNDLFVKTLTFIFVEETTRQVFKIRISNWTMVIRILKAGSHNCYNTHISNKSNHGD